MKYANVVQFGRPQSGLVILQLMTEFVVSNNYIPEQQYLRKESNALILATNNRMLQCTYFENI